MKKELVKRVQKRANTPKKIINLLREELHHLLLQEINKSGGFQNLCFLGGTAIRIIYNLGRYSEDLDFSVSSKSVQDFQLGLLTNKVSFSLNAYGFPCRVGKLKENRNVQSCFFNFYELLPAINKIFHRDRKLAIKLDVDTNPPKGAIEEVSPISTPRVYTIRHYNLPSLMAGKIHALCTRQYVKGRDYYDFLWYQAKRPPIEPNLELLQAALNQSQENPWDAKDWKKYLFEKFEKTDWKKVVEDVEAFLERPDEASLLNKEIFTNLVKAS